MMLARVSQPSIEEIRELQPNAMDHFMLCDMGGLLHESRSVDMSERGRMRLECGTPELTELAEKYLDKFESEIFIGRSWNVIDDVVGALPNVPAMLAGHPASMRRRKRTTSHTAPLSIFFELTGSSGAMDSRAQRGAAMLALVRFIANVRPVEFWTLNTYGHRDVMTMIACKMDSQPIDVARAAAQLCDSEVVSAMYSISSQKFNRGGSFRGGWSYGYPDLERKWSGHALKRLISPSSEMLFIPAAYLDDFNLTDPVKWIKDMLHKYGMDAVKREDE